MGAVVKFKNKNAPDLLPDQAAKPQGLPAKKDLLLSGQQVLQAHKTNNNKAEKPGYQSWSSMKQRCRNSKNPFYPKYGGRGIKYSPAWETYAGFFADMGIPPKEGMTLDRIDPNGDYDAANCRWATKLEQTRNRTSTHKAIYRGEEVPVAELAARFGVKPRRLAEALKTFGGDAELALRGLAPAPGAFSARTYDAACPGDRWPPSLEAVDYWEGKYRQRHNMELTRPEYLIVATDEHMRHFEENEVEDPKVDKLALLRRDAWQLIRVMGLDQSTRWLRWKNGWS